MDAALYHRLYEEVQQDAARVERQLEELRFLESFLLHRIKTARDLGSYQVVLSDLAGEITEAEELLAELLHLSRFVSRALITAYSTKPAEPAPAVAEKIDLPILDEAPRLPLTQSGIEFDEHGFPIVALASKNSSLAGAVPKEIPSEDSRAPEPIFDEHGFPMKASPDESNSTIVELPKASPPARPMPSTGK